MRWSTIMVMVITGALLTPLLIVAETAHTASPGKAEPRGRSYFKQYCSTCHGIDGRGNGPKARGLQTPLADLTQIARRHGGHFPEQQIIDYIDGRTSIRGYHHDHGMPVWGRQFTEMTTRSGSQRRAKKIMFALVQYLKTIQKGPDED